MAAFVRTRQTAIVLTVAAGLSILLAFTRFLDLTSHAFAQEGTAQTEAKPPVGQEPQDEGSADKKSQPGGDLQKFMRQKLQASNLILEGLCTEDLALVNKGAETLMKMSKEEKWRVSNDMMYRRYSKEFGEAAEELQKEATDNDMDGTSMAWVNVTMKCLKCHEWVRNTVLADSLQK
jgi:hypothetical protein